MFNTTDVPKSSRIPKLVEALYANMPVIESARAKLLTESYKATEGEPMVTRRAEAFAHILRNIPIIIRDNELIVGSSTIAPRGCQTFPEFSFQWLEDELDTVETRSADPFYIAEETKQELREVHKYWKGKTSSELATSYMDPEAIKAIEHNIFTPGNYVPPVLHSGHRGHPYFSRKEHPCRADGSWYLSAFLPSHHRPPYRLRCRSVLPRQVLPSGQRMARAAAKYRR